MKVDQRAGDPGYQTYDRLSRYMELNGQWYFNTREQTIIGPFELKDTMIKGAVIYAKQKCRQAEDCDKKKNLELMVERMRMSKKAS